MFPQQSLAFKKTYSIFPELDTEQKIESHFPISEATTDYLNASSNIRDNRARIVTVTFRVASLFLDAASRDKFLRLVGETRYNVVDDNVTLSSDRLPYRCWIYSLAVLLDAPISTAFWWNLTAFSFSKVGNLFNEHQIEL